MSKIDDFHHNAVTAGDEGFLQSLKEFLGEDFPPTFSNPDGSINRERTLAEPCYAGYKITK